jgi:hypothetical protein
MSRRNSDEECAFCDRIWGVFGIATGALIMLIGIDLLSGGLIGKLVGKSNAGTITDSIDDSDEEEEYDDEDDAE